MSTGPRRSWLALLPASKGTTAGGDGPPWRDVCGPHGRQVAEALAIAATTLDEAALAKLTETPGTQIGEVRRTNLTVVEAPTLPAWRRYVGVVHTSADPASLASDARRRYLRHIAYVSAIGGLVHADEPLPAYRLPMGANLPGVGPLAAFWRDRIEQSLAERLTPGARLWLLTGTEYERAVTVPVGVRRVDVRFVEDKAGRDVSPPSAAVKQMRGLIARKLATSNAFAREPAGLGWRSTTFEAGLRSWRLEDVDEHQQTWRATPSAT